MSARTDLVATLKASLPDKYRVVGSPTVPDQIEVDTRAVRCWATSVTPAPTLAGLTIPLVVWVLTPKTTPGDADDDLDEALDELLAVLHPLKWVRWVRAERGVMDNDNGTSWHGWRLDLNAFGQITED